MKLDSLNVHWMLILISLVIILSFLFNLVAKKTRIPTVILLIATGYIFGLIFDVNDDFLKPVLEILGTVGLIMIVLEATLDIHLEKSKQKLIVNAFWMAIVLLISCSLAIGFLIQWIYEVPFPQALLYSIPLSILSSAIIIPSVAQITREKKEFMVFESALSDILGIMFFYFLSDSIGTESIPEITYTIIGNLVITFILAIILGFGLILVLQRINSEIKLFLPIAILSLIYGVGKLFHLSSLVFVMAFGLFINNMRIFSVGRLKKIIDMEAINHILDDMKLLTLESSFLVRTFFFVVFGMSISFTGITDLTVLMLCGASLLIIYLFRFISLSAIQKDHMTPAVFIAPRGLISILLFYAIPEQYQIVTFRPALLMLMIILTNLIMMFGLIRSAVEDEEEDAAPPKSDMQRWLEKRKIPFNVDRFGIFRKKHE